MSLEELLKITPQQLNGIKNTRTKNDEDLQKDIEIIKDWYKKQVHLPQNFRDDDFLAMLIHHNKYSLEKTKRKLDAYFSMPHLYPEFFKDRGPLNPRIQKSLACAIYLPLPTLTETLGRVSILKYLDCESLDHEAVYTRILMTADLRYFHDSCTSETLIIDLENFSFSSILTWNPLTLKKFLTIIEKGYSDSIGNIHILNMPQFAISGWNLIKPMMREKFLSRVVMHKNKEEFLEFFPKEMLPKDYGGYEKSLQDLQDEWTSFMVKKNDWFLDKSIRQSNETLREGPPLENDILGIQGTFRQLTVD